MNIKLMLTRLQSALGSHDLVEQMVLLPPASINADVAKSTKLNGSPEVASANPARKLNLVVGYNKTPSSQTALDLTLWIAHQTRLATREQVTVHIVYVAEFEGRYPNSDAITTSPSADRLPLELLEDSTLRSTTPILTTSTHSQVEEASEWTGMPVGDPQATSLRTLTKSKHQVLTACPQMTVIAPCFNTASAQQFAEGSSLALLSQAQTNTCEQADQILERAQRLAQEWGGAFKTHVRVGEVAKELRKVVEREAATLLLLGCHSVDHPIVQQLGADFPCVVLGIPQGAELSG